MDIHKPKPWHGLREFGKELATIVLGVLIALGAEQVAENLRLAQQAETLDASLASALQPILLDAEERLVLAPCLDARIAHLRDKLLKSDGAWTADPETFAVANSKDLSAVMPEAFHTPGRPWSTDAWQYALGTPALAHLTLERRGSFLALYNQAAFSRVEQETELAAETQLMPLSYDLQLTPELKAHFLEQLGMIARQEGSLRGGGAQMIAGAAEIGIKPSPANLKKVVATQRAFRGTCVQDVGA